MWDDVWLPLGAAAGHIPVVYPYIVDNLGEALTAKRRGRAVLVSHRTPAFAPAGFNARMAHMHELMHEWETVDAGPTRQALERRLIAQFVEHQLHRDLGWTADAIARDFEGYLSSSTPTWIAWRKAASRRAWPCWARCPARRAGARPFCRRCASP
jgi:cobaltochelatase CobN